MTDLLVTKLHQPAPPPKHIERHKLTRRLNAGLGSGHQVFLVSAPAGFGKTTCVIEWMNSIKRCPMAWLSLDAADDDPIKFFAYLLAAFQKINEHIGYEITGTLRAGQLPPVDVISTTLINDILEFGRKIIFVLDDFHVLQEQFILEFFENLLANLPPQFCLVLITREDPPLPLAQLRANNRLTEVRAKDLRFEKEDIGSFLSEVMGLSISPLDIDILEDKTEGWIAGLQLAALSLQDQSNLSAFIANLSGNHRHILAYLTEQVLDQQPEEIRIFLLQTAILDKLNDDLCNAVTGRSDSHAILQQLFSANLFLIPLDDVGEWYRYHHLFADLLRSMQKTHQSGNIAELHQRASHWYLQAGMTNEAIRHALAGDDYAFAVDLLEGHALNMVMHGYAKTVDAWVQKLPVEWGLQSPRANLALAWVHLLRGTYSQAHPYLERLESLFSGAQGNETEKQSLKAEWLVMQSLLLNMEGKLTQGLALVKEALEIVPADDHRVRSLAQFGLATTYRTTGDNQLAADAYKMALQFSRDADNAIVEMLSTSGLAQMAFEHGQLHRAYEIAAHAGSQIERSGLLHPISTVVFGILGDVSYQWLQTKQARQYYELALQLSTLGGYNSGVIGCRVFFSRLFQFEGDFASAGREIQTAFELMQVDTPEYIRKEAVSQQVRVHLARDQFLAAEVALQAQGFSFGERFSYPALTSELSIDYSNGLLYNSSLWFLLYQARAESDATGLKSGIELANQLVSKALAGQSLPVALEAFLLRAQMNAMLGEYTASQADYVNAVELGQPEGILGVFVEHGQPVAETLMEMVRRKQLGDDQLEYARRILDALSARRFLDEEPAPVPAGGTGPESLIEPLTEREIEVLRLMADGLKYKEIAAKLFISHNTVRFHVKSLYGKLNVNNRTRALEKARQLQIL